MLFSLRGIITLTIFHFLRRCKNFKMTNNIMKYFLLVYGKGEYGHSRRPQQNLYICGKSQN